MAPFVIGKSLGSRTRTSFPFVPFPLSFSLSLFLSFSLTPFSATFLNRFLFSSARKVSNLKSHLTRGFFRNARKTCSRGPFICVRVSGIMEVDSYVISFFFFANCRARPFRAIGISGTFLLPSDIVNTSVSAKFDLQKSIFSNRNIFPHRCILPC